MDRSRICRASCVTALACLASACAPSGFADPAIVSSVRILASSASEPYAKPGDQVDVSVLAFDGRASKPSPMKIFWIPFVCENPADDAYYNCFEQLATGAVSDAGPRGSEGGTIVPVVSQGDAGTADVGTEAGANAESGAPTGISLKPGEDLTRFLRLGSTFHFTMPGDAITSHPVVAGTPVPYGLAILFNIACAGHVELVPFGAGGNPQQPPIGCFDANHNALGPDDWVFGYTRVFAYADVTNTNPVIQSIDVPPRYVGAGCGANSACEGGADAAGDGVAMDGAADADAEADAGSGVATEAGLDAGTDAAMESGLAVTGMPPSYSTNGIKIPHCSGNCSGVSIGPQVPATSQELQSQLGPGAQLKEEIWADFYATSGSFKNDARLLYDTTTGSVGRSSVTDNVFTPPDTPGTGTMWIVVHDNRGGASWVTIPLTVQ